MLTSKIVILEKKLEYGQFVADTSERARERATADANQLRFQVEELHRTLSSISGFQQTSAAKPNDSEATIQFSKKNVQNWSNHENCYAEVSNVTNISGDGGSHDHPSPPPRHSRQFAHNDPDNDSDKATCGESVQDSQTRDTSALGEMNSDQLRAKFVQDSQFRLSERDSFKAKLKEDMKMLMRSQKLKVPPFI